MTMNHHILLSALEVVERDVRAGGITGTLRLVNPDWDDSDHVRVEFRGGFHGNGIPPLAGNDFQGALVDVADAVQEVVVELTWTVWPVCATHDQGLHPTIADGIAVWRCTGEGTHTVAPVGDLP